MKKILFIQHGETDKPGLLAEALDRGRVAFEIAHPYLGETLPASLEAFAGLAVGGRKHRGVAHVIWPAGVAGENCTAEVLSGGLHKFNPRPCPIPARLLAPRRNRNGPFLPAGLH